MFSQCWTLAYKPILVFSLLLLPVTSSAPGRAADRTSNGDSHAPVGFVANSSGAAEFRYYTSLTGAGMRTEVQTADSPKVLSGRITVDESAKPTNGSISGSISSSYSLVSVKKGDLEIRSVHETVPGRKNAAIIYARFTHLENWLLAHPELQSQAGVFRQANADPLGIPIYTTAGLSLHKDDPGNLARLQSSCARYPIPTQPPANFGNAVLVLKADVFSHSQDFCDGLDYVVRVTYTVR